jgi:hypothetical protein
MKANMETGGITPLILNLGTRMDVGGKRHATAALPKVKDPDTQSTDSWVGPREGRDVLERIVSLLHSGI